MIVNPKLERACKIWINKASLSSNINSEIKQILREVHDELTEIIKEINNGKTFNHVDFMNGLDRILSRLKSIENYVKEPHYAAIYGAGSNTRTFTDEYTNVIESIRLLKEEIRNDWSKYKQY